VLSVSADGDVQPVGARMFRSFLCRRTRPFQYSDAQLPRGAPRPRERKTSKLCDGRSSAVGNADGTTLKKKPTTNTCGARRFISRALSRSLFAPLQEGLRGGAMVGALARLLHALPLREDVCETQLTRW
jgi:hypothetical protein